MTPVFNNISDELRALITPLKPSETATYRIITTGQQAIEELADGTTTARVLLPPSTTFSAQATIYDPYKNDNVEIMASAGSRRTKDGLEPVEADITFKNGVLTVRGNQPELYRFMELNPANRDCVIPGNNPDKGFQFERVQVAKSAKTAAVSMKMGIDAQNELALFGYDELKRAALRLKLDATKSRDELFVDLVTLAQSNGELVYNAIGDRAIQVESLAATAVSEGVLEWAGEERMYKLRESRQTFLPVPNGNPEDELVAQLMSPRFHKQRTLLEKLVGDKQKAKKK